MVRKWVDTNIIIRAVTGQPPDMAHRLLPILHQAAQGDFELVVPSIVVAEAVYVLEGTLGFSRKDVARALRAFCGLKGVELEEFEVILTALSDYEETHVDFADAYLGAKVKLTGDVVLTWNSKDFRKIGASYEAP
ncbi:PIN domain-containing protein [Alicyclobacillus acidocaldarius]|uniref:PilT protein domain protein n=1 Tax=Alicyclobacillus acidocaldarius subsp. acidocaldarius (strain ATCC 27009 / DSM 446 / BCRC 14685 / JCM 5260 / KCTC 1825 / NBRC 15652 / NCIMB 11725 / NRRL B-14509 / 104-IA) TaxID=521098 RepID=C8WVW4_ALIAD|nr:PIN domain-containing protein [Alicyclobacillus acidocaldarius]ACV58236.1 PilT protein domain protein [Alicyclobacillus acidocaldarius subsp. acidocaldarius DSM 446]